MPALLVVAHAPLASALRAVAEHVYPERSARLAALDVDPGMQPEDVAAQARALLASLDAREALILVDVFGATPCNAALAAGRRRRACASSPASTCRCSGARCAIADLPLDELVDARGGRRRAGRDAGRRVRAGRTRLSHRRHR
ncbi:MAG: PTS fructose transporter subunit IIA [Comamonadaceae bacterium]|nr:PTS fructose transporter subunit IIA [Comamonadaceae bacterium]